MKKITLLRIGGLLVAVGLCFLGARLTDNNTPHQKYFYIRCIKNGHITYEAKSTEYPAGNFLQGLGTCQYVYR